MRQRLVMFAPGREGPRIREIVRMVRAWHSRRSQPPRSRSRYGFRSSVELVPDVERVVRGMEAILRHDGGEQS